MIRKVAFSKAILAGALGSMAWEFTYRLASFFFPLQFDLVKTLGSLIFPQSEIWLWWSVGMLAHAAVGSVWAIFYAYFFWSSFRLRPTYQGLIFSIIPSLGAGLSLVPQLRYLHPDPMQALHSDYSFFAYRLGLQGPLSLFGLHFVYGLVMGTLYRRPVGSPVRLESQSLQWARARRNTSNLKAVPTAGQGHFLFCTGIECSYPTIENGKWRIDEMQLANHYQNWERDLELVAQLGIGHLRYGPPLHRIFLGPGRYDWSFVDAVFLRMQELHITPIVDLCHFGLPAWLGNFQNHEFPQRLAEYAAAMAKRYPWIRYWNPVNEMFVAARESALRGTWNEQLKSERAFVRATSHMVQASHLVMKEILKVRSDAIFFTSESSEFYQACCPDPEVVKIAEFENERRFLASDLLHSNPVSPQMKDYLLANGMQEREYADFMQAHLSSKIIMGLDYYPWNEKLINSKGESESLGELFGWYVITKQYYDRYQRPLFHSETNSMDATQGPDWLWRQWHNLQLMRKQGVPVVGFTWYSLQDQIDWNIGISEPLGNVNPVGLYDFNHDPRPVVIAFQQLLKMYRGEKLTDPALRGLQL